MKLRFDCSECPGYCCSHALIEVSDADIRRLARHFSVPEEAARVRFTYHYRSQQMDAQVLRHQKDDIFKSVCRFFDRKTRRCGIYEARPGVCRTYPYGNRCGYYDFLKFERIHQDDEDFIPSA